MKHLKNLIQTLFIACISVLIYQYWVNQHKTTNNKVDDIVDLVYEKYVDSVNVNDLKKVALNAIFEHLDPHSAYLEASDIVARNEDLQGTFFGIGVRYSIIQDSLVVTGILPNGPASVSPLQMGDRIIAVDDTEIKGKWLLADSIKYLLKGPENTAVHLEVFRRANHEKIPISVNRGVVVVPTVDAYYLLQPEIGYLRLNIFGENTTEEVLNTIAFLLEKGANKIIFDLRDNGGGYLKSVLEILEELLPANKLILYTEGKSSPRQDFYTVRQGLLEAVPLVVLINQNSASASEIMSGTLQDHDRALLVGRRSFGKGLVQEPFPRKDGSEVLLTIAKYYIPSGRCVQKPYHKAKSEYYQDDMMARINNGELFHKENMPQDENKVYYTANERKVYGGGGIIPDVFVPMENDADHLIDSLLSQQTLANFSFLHAEQLNFKLPYQNFTQIQQHMEIDQKTFADFLKFAAGQKMELPKDLSEHQKQKIKNWIKAFTVLHVFQNEEFYFEQLLAEEDPVIRTAIDSFQQYDPLLQSQI